METSSGNRVCVVGAGIAGLAAAKVLRDDGFEVVAFEKKANIGGVWAPSRTYPALRTNTTREQYAYSDFPYPESADSFPTAEQVRSYLESYGDHFKLRDLFRLSTEVVSISRVPARSSEIDSRFQVVVRPTGSSGEPETLYFDYVAVCNGAFSIPNVPHIDGNEQFAGPVVHSSQFTDTSLVEGKRVIVVGAGKSALDCATVAARHAQSCTLVFREPHWMAPRYIFGVRYDRLFFTRFAEAFYHYYHTGPAEALLHGPGKPLVQLFWQAQSAFIRHYLRIPDELVPGHPLPGKLEIGVGGDFYSVMREGRAVAKRAEIASFANATSVELGTGERIEADAVIGEVQPHAVVGGGLSGLLSDRLLGRRCGLLGGCFGDDDDRHELRQRAPGFQRRAQLALAQHLLLGDELARLDDGEADDDQPDAVEHRVDHLEARQRLDDAPDRGGEQDNEEDDKGRGDKPAADGCVFTGTHVRVSPSPCPGPGPGRSTWSRCRGGFHR